MGNSRLAGMVAIVTGSGRGIGRSEAMLMLAREGTRVVVSDLGTDGDGKSLAAGVTVEIRKAGGEALLMNEDLMQADGGTPDHRGRRRSSASTVQPLSDPVLMMTPPPALAQQGDSELDRQERCLPMMAQHGGLLFLGQLVRLSPAVQARVVDDNVVAAEGIALHRR